MTCRGKRRHETEVQALRVIDRAKDKTKRGACNRRERRAYHCIICHGWHVTSEGYQPKAGAA